MCLCSEQFQLVQQINSDFDGAPFMLSYHIISWGMLNTGKKWEAKQADFTLPFRVSTGIKLNRKQPYFLFLFLEGRRIETDRLQLYLCIETRMRMLGTIGRDAIVKQPCCCQVRVRLKR